jgi:hypothetical protein
MTMTMTENNKKESSIKTHVRFLSAELLSVSDRHYFHHNGRSYKLTKEQLDKVLIEVKDMNPLQAAQYLIKLADKKEFTKITG